MNRVGQLIAKLKGIVWELENTKMERANVCWEDELEDVAQRLSEVDAHWKQRDASFENPKEMTDEEINNCEEVKRVGFKPRGKR